MKWGPRGGFGQKSELLMSFQQDHSAAVLRAVLLVVVEGSRVEAGYEIQKMSISFLITSPLRSRWFFKFVCLLLLLKETLITDLIHFYPEL